MAAPKFTPGPWTIEEPMGADNPWIVEAGKAVHEWRCLAIVPCDADDDEVPRLEAEANARLIAAAPDLYRLLTAAKHALRSYQYGNAATDLAKDIADDAEKLIAKAEGR